ARTDGKVNIHQDDLRFALGQFNAGFFGAAARSYAGETRRRFEQPFKPLADSMVIFNDGHPEALRSSTVNVFVDGFNAWPGSIVMQAHQHGLSLKKRECPALKSYSNPSTGSSL